MKKLSTIYFLLFLGVFQTAVAQTITGVATSLPTGATSYCAGSSFNVTFTATGFPVGTTFTIELSNAAGSFSAPVSLGTATASPASVTLPAGTTAGAGYKVQIKGGTPLITTAMAGTFTATTIPVGPTVTTPVSYCQNATATALTATGSALKWYTTATGGMGSATAPTPSTTTAGSPAVTHYVSQTVSGCESVRASIAVNVTASPVAPTVTTPVSYCQNATATALTATGTALKWYTAATGGVGSATAPTPSTTTAGSPAVTHYVSQTVSGCESARASIAINVNARPTSAPTTTIAPTLCKDDVSAPLIATPNTGNTAKWYTVSTGGTALTTAPTPNTNVTATTTTTYYVTQENVNNCEYLPRTTVTVTVNYTAPPTVTATLPVIECQGQMANPLSNHVTAAATGFSLVYYGTASTVGTATTVATVPSTALTGTTTYYVVMKNNTTTCESTPRTAISVLVNPTPTAPGVVSPVNICQNGLTAPLSSTPSSGGTLSWWSTNATGGTASTTAPTPSSATLGSVSYYVSQTVLSCQSSRVPVNVITNALPTAPTASSVLYCQNDVSTAMTGTPTATNTLKWYNGTTPLVSAPIPNTNISTTTTYNYAVSQVTPSPASCEGPRTAVTATVYFTTAPTVSNITYCQNDSSVLLTATGTSIGWYSALSGGTALSVAPKPSTTNVGVTTYFVTQRLYVAGSFAGCENIPRTPISVTVNPQPAAPSLTTPIIYCQNYSSVPLTASGSTLKWYTVPTGGEPSSSITPSTTNVGNTNYYVTQTNSFSCESPRNLQVVTINPTPAQPAVSPITFCQNYATSFLVATPNSGNTLSWYGLNATGGTASPSGPAPPTGPVGTTYYYVSQTNAFNCESPRIALTVTVNPTPAAPPVRTPDIYCQNETPQPLSVSVASGNNPRWYDASNNPIASTPTPNTNNAGSNTYYATQTNGFNCESPKTQIGVTVKPLPAAPSVPNNNYILCQLDPTLNLSATGTGLRWYYPNGDVSSDAPIISTGAGLQTSYSVSSTVDGCEGAKTPINVTIRTTPLVVVPSDPLVFCQQTNKFEPINVTGTTLKWYDKPTAGSQVTINAGKVFLETPGTYYYYVTQTNASTGCESPRAEVIGIVQPLPTATITGDNNVSQGQSVTLKIVFTGQQPWTYTLSNGFTTTTTQNPTTVTVTPVETVVYTVTKIANNCGNGTPIGSATVNVRSATIQTGNPNVASLCAGTSFSIPFFSSDFIPSNAVYTLQISKTNTDASFQNIPTENTDSPLKGTIPNATPGGSYFVRVAVTATGFSLKGQVSPVQVLVRELPIATISGPTSLYENETAKLSITLTGESPWNLVYRDSLAQQNISKDQLTVSPYEFSAVLKESNTYSIVSVTNACGSGPVTSKLRVKVNPLLSVGSAPKNSEWLKVYPMPVVSKCIVEIDGNLQAKPAQIQVIDVLGRVTNQQKTVESSVELDLQKLRSGTYFIKVEQNGRTATRKILKVD